MTILILAALLAVAIYVWRDRLAVWLRAVWFQFGNEWGAYGNVSDFAEVWLVTGLSSTTSPSVAQINAGTRLTDDIRNVQGFTSDTNFFEVPTLKGGDAPKLTGRRVVQDSSITFAEHTTSAANTIKSALTEGLETKLVFSRYKKGNLSAGDKVTVFTVKVGGNNPANWSVEDAPLEFVVSFGITAAPNKDVTTAA